MVLSPVMLVVAVVASAIAALIDWRTGKIPNELTLSVVVLGLLLQAVLAGRQGGLSAAGSGLGWGLLGLLACGIVPLLIWLAKGGGGGDVKMMGALGALLGPMVGLEAETYMFAGAALYAMAWMAYEGKLLRTLGNSLRLVANPLLPKDKRDPLPEAMMTELRFGPAIFVGTCMAAYLNWRNP